MKISVFGASGKTGEQVVKQLLAAGHDVNALVRGELALTHAKLRVLKGDVTSGVGVDDAIAGTDAVIACLGARNLKANTVRSDSARAIVGAMNKAGVKKLVWLSASGVGDSAAQAKSTSFFFGYIIMPLMLKANYADALLAENAIKASGVDFVIARPVGLNDDAAKGGPRGFSNTDKLTKGYIARADVAAFMIDAALSTQWDKKTPSVAYA